MNLDDLVIMAREAFGNVAPAAGRPRNPESPRAPVPDWMPSVDAVPDKGFVSEEPRGRAVLPVWPDDKLVVESSDEVPLDMPKGPPPDRVETHGADVLAYYLPFHFHASNWGIYVLASGIAYLAERLKNQRLTARDSDVVQAAYATLYEHEHTHFVCEAMAALGEAAHLHSWYLHFFRDAEAAGKEESLCNAQALKAVRGRGTRDLRARLATWMSLQGDGYGRFSECSSSAGTRKTRHGLVRRMRLPDPDETDEEKARWTVDVLHIWNARHWPAEVLWASVTGWRSRKQVPTYLVFDRSVPWLRVARPFPKFEGVMVRVYSNDHDPPHFHLFMPPPAEHGHGYMWPHLEPASAKSPPLGRSQRKSIEAYLARFGSEIHDKLQRVYARRLPPLP